MMGINPERGPDDGAEIVGNVFSAMTEGPADIFSAEAGGTGPAARIRRPLPIYSVDLRRLRDQGAKALETARRTGWRYIVEHGSRLNVIDLPEGGDRQPRILGAGEVGGNLTRSGRKSERIVEDEVDYEPRILDLNIIGDSVLWLHAPDPSMPDRFVSLAKGARELNAEALIKRIRTAAERKLTAMEGVTGEAGG